MGRALRDANNVPTLVGVSSADGTTVLPVYVDANNNGLIISTSSDSATQHIDGNVATGATDSGNPVKTGAVFNTTQPTVTNTQRVDNQATSRGGLIVSTGVDPFIVSLTPNATDGWTPSSQTALTNTVVSVKSSQGTMGGYMFFNNNTSTTFIQVFNVASGSVTLGTTTPTYVIPLPANAGANMEISNGIQMGTAISAAATTTATGLTAPTNALVGFFMFK